MRAIGYWVMAGLLMLCVQTNFAFAQGEHARRAAAELRLVVGDARQLAGGPKPSELHAKGLRERITGSLSGLNLLLRLADQETGKPFDPPTDAVRALLALRQANDWAGLVSAAQVLARNYPLAVPQISAGKERAKAIHNELCAVCHDEPDLDVERPAYNLFGQAKAQAEDEFLARLIIGVRGDRVTGFSNPLTAPELRALSDYYRTTNK